MHARTESETLATPYFASCSFYEAITDNEGLAKGSALHVNQGLLECNHKDVGV